MAQTEKNADRMTRYTTSEQKPKPADSSEASVFREHVGFLTSFNFSEDGGQITFMVECDGYLFLWKMKSEEGKKMFRLGEEPQITRVRTKIDHPIPVKIHNRIEDGEAQILNIKRVIDRKSPRMLPPQRKQDGCF